MVQVPVYLDNQSTTAVDPRVLEAMLPYFSEKYGNPGSTSHVLGWQAAEAVDDARESIATAIGARARDIVFTSGATESCNLAIRGLAEHKRRKGKHIVGVATEHRAVLDPLKRLASDGFEITLLPVEPNGGPHAGCITAEQVAEAMRDDTTLVAVMLANNEIGVIQPLAEIAAVCQARDVLLFSDATQAVGKIPVDVAELGVDLMAFSAHKFYGPPGVGALHVKRRNTRLRIRPLLDGGGQENGLRSGTLNVPGIVGMDQALRLCLQEMPAEAARMATLRDRLHDGLISQVSGASLNGPSLQPPGLRLPGNLNMCLADVDGEALMLSMRDLCVSSGSACTSASPEPSHVLRGLGLSEDEVHASLRFGLGRSTTEAEIDFAIAAVAEGVRRLRQLNGASG